MERSTDIAKLAACIKDPPLVQFQSDMSAVESQIWLYIELQRSRSVTTREEVETEHRDLFWIARGAVVTAFSAVDRLIHALLQQRLSSRAFERVRYRTFQAAPQITDAMALIGITDIYTTVARKYSADVMTAQQIQNTLNAYYRRKNRITHHADSDDLGNRLTLSASEAHECCKFLREFGNALHSAVFGI